MEGACAKPGLRERKKQQTRSALISAALELCDRQGFDATTVEQIADAVDISPRTFNRYFATKEDVVLGPIEEMVTAVVAALDAQPRTGNELEALRDAHLQVFHNALDDESPSPLLEQFMTMNRIVAASPAVRARSVEMGEWKTQSIRRKVAERMGLDEDDLKVRVVMSTYGALMQLAMDQWQPDCQPTDREAMARCVQSIESTYATFREMVPGA
ncbi:TetR family transcriptional regulator [Gordonia rhizosphera]|uniref:Putative TetR family transcriptional regulator n=1 Tax=Gordonia rhizosphera NBRC 16068 TaxID=1108045 RepID=K6WUB5_9ACTN|nr:TetR family transcriptional regulator [Gordonia rhizosphera]GAB90149.1 putative TetR family transcriptional regulator [Gordonia rhizosphera NBRC 16068]